MIRRLLAYDTAIICPTCWLKYPTQELQAEPRAQHARADCSRLMCIAFTQSLDPEQPDLCLFYIEVAFIPVGKDRGR